MTTVRTLKVSTADLGYASVDAQSREIDWTEACGEDFEGWRVIYPSLTFGDLAEHAEDLLTPAQARVADRSPYKPAPQKLIEQFEETRAGYEWRDAFQPMMNFVWPAFIPYGMSSQDVADRLAQFAPTVSLVTFDDDSHCGEDYGYALSGGGMNLSDQLAAAYLCAHQIPPLSLLEALPGVIGEYKLRQIGRPLRAAYRLAANAMKLKAQRLAETGARVFKAK